MEAHDQANYSATSEAQSCAQPPVTPVKWGATPTPTLTPVATDFVDSGVMTSARKPAEDHSVAKPPVQSTKRRRLDVNTVTTSQPEPNPVTHTKPDGPKPQPQPKAEESDASQKLPLEDGAIDETSYDSFGDDDPAFGRAKSRGGGGGGGGGAAAAAAAAVGAHSGTNKPATLHDVEPYHVQTTSYSAARASAATLEPGKRSSPQNRVSCLVLRLDDRNVRIYAAWYH